MSGKQVSVAARPEKGKSAQKKHSGWLLGQRFCLFMSFEIPKEQDQENDDSQNEYAKVVARAAA
jgi:hypothetical protein